MKQHTWEIHYDHIVEVGTEKTKAKRKKIYLATDQQKLIEAENAFHFWLDAVDKSQIISIKYLGPFIDPKIDSKSEPKAVDNV